MSPSSSRLQRCAESSPQTVSIPAVPKAWTWFFCSGLSFHSQHLEYLDQLRLFFVLLEAASQFHSGSQHLECLHCTAWEALWCMVCPLSSCSTFSSPGKALGHREGISATAAGIAVPVFPSGGGSGCWWLRVLRAGLMLRPSFCSFFLWLSSQMLHAVK